jgi:hypothetical protein
MRLAQIRKHEMEDNLKYICTTSNRHIHIVPIFCHLFNLFWSPEQEVEIVGYNPPKMDLPPNFTFHSMGEQIGGPENFSNDLRRYFERQEQFFIWMMEDTFVKKVYCQRLKILESLINVENIGRINLSEDTCKHDHIEFGKVDGYEILETTPTAEYRLSTQVSIWNRDFLLKYMTQDLTPWGFETQATEDNFRILGPKLPAVEHNEGVRRWDVHEYNFTGIPEEVVSQLRALVDS